MRLRGHEFRSARIIGSDALEFNSLPLEEQEKIMKEVDELVQKKSEP